MKRQRKVLLAGILALGAFACFNDPTSDLRNGPARLNLSRASATILNGDSIAVTGTLVDAQGNALATNGATWSTDAAGAALVRVTVDTINPAPGAIFTRAFVTGISNQPGVATVTATAGGQAASFNVTVLPSTFPGTAAVTGAAGADTITINNPAPAPPTVVVYTAGDTLVLTAPANITFANNATVSFGTIPAMLLSNSGTIIKALARAPYAGRVTITNLVYAGVAVTGPVAIATIRTDSINIQHARWRGTQAVTADPNFGPATLVTVTAPANMTFDATSGFALGGTPVIGAAAAVPPTSIIVLTRTSTTMQGISPVNITNGTVLVTGALVGTARIDSVRAGSIATGSVTMNKAAFPGTVAQTGTNLLDTITVSGGAAATFTTAAATASQVTVGGVAAFVLSRTASTIKVISKLVNAGPISISNVIIGGTTIPSLATNGTITVNATTGETNEPGNNASATATAIGTLAAAKDSIVVYAAMDGGADQRDYYKFTLTTTGTISVLLDFFGNGGGSSDLNPDFDVVVCTTLSGAGSCSYGQDLIPSNAASAVNQPEQGTTASITATPGAPVTVYVRTFAYYATAAGLGSYRLRVKTP